MNKLTHPLFLHIMAAVTIGGKYLFPMFCYLVIRYGMWVYGTMLPDLAKEPKATSPQVIKFLKYMGHMFAPPMLAGSMFIYLIC